MRQRQLALTQLGIDAAVLLLHQPAAHHGADAQPDRLGAGGGRDQVVRPRLEDLGQHLPPRALVVAEAHDLEGRPLARPAAQDVQAAAQCQAVEARAQHGDHDAVPGGAFRLDGGERLLRPGDGLDGIAILRQQAAHPGPAGGAVLHQQDGGAAEGRLSLRAGGRRRFRGVLRPAAQQRPQPQQDHLLPCGLGDIGIGAAFQPLPLQLLLPRIGQHQHRERPGAQVHADAAGELVAVDAGQVIVGDHQIGQPVVQPVQRRLRRGRARHREALLLQHPAKLQGLGVGILDQQDAGSGRAPAAHVPASGMARRSRRGAIRCSGRFAEEPPSRTAAAGMP